MFRLEEVSKIYRRRGAEVVAFQTAALEIPTGQYAAIVGPSGSGKTTLLSILGGMLAPDRGKVWLGPTSLYDLSATERARRRGDAIGFVFQTFNLLSGFSALENVQLGMTFARGRRDGNRARQLLERVGLSHRLHHTPGTMSVGEQQRTAVARALANQPKLLLADEPTANVDPANQQAIVDLIRQTCQEEGVALIIVTHAMEVAQQFDRIDRLEDINRAVSTAISRIALAEDVPVLFGVLTCETMEQAIHRAGGNVGNKGSECAEAAVEMVRLLKNLP